MANILSNGNNWSGYNNQVPAPEWNGRTYDFLGSPSTGKYYGGDTLIYQDAVQSGDVAAGSIVSTSADRTSFAIIVNEATVFSTSLTANNPVQFTTGPLSADANVSIQLGVGDFLYSQDAVMTPSTIAPIISPGFMLATGDTLSPSSGPGTLVTFTPPTIPTIYNQAASYVRAPYGAAVVFYGVTPVYTLPLPEDVGQAAYEAAPKMRYVWRSKKFVFPGQTTFAAAKVVHSCQGGGVRFRLYIDCCCVFETVVRGCVAFRLPQSFRGITAEIELLGCSRVTEVRVASSIRELMNDE